MPTRRRSSRGPSCAARSLWRDASACGPVRPSAFRAGLRLPGTRFFCVQRCWWGGRRKKLRRGGREETVRGRAAPVVAGRGVGTEPGGAVRPRLLAEGTSGRKREKPPGGRVVRVRLLPEGALDRKREKPPGGRVVRARLLPEGALARSRAGRGRQSGVGAGGQTLTVRMSSRSVV